LELSNLPVEVSGHEALAKEFDAVHPFVGKMIPQIIF
jgi:hypothetical protein